MDKCELLFVGPFDRKSISGVGEMQLFGRLANSTLPCAVAR